MIDNCKPSTVTYMRISAVHLSLLAICSIGIYIDSVGHDAEPGVYEPLASQIISGHDNNAYGVTVQAAGHDQYFTPVTAMNGSPPTTTGLSDLASEGRLGSSVANIDDLSNDGISYLEAGAAVVAAAAGDDAG